MIQYGNRQATCAHQFERDELLHRKIEIQKQQSASAPSQSSLLLLLSYPRSNTVASNVLLYSLFPWILIVHFRFWCSLHVCDRHTNNLPFAVSEVSSVSLLFHFLFYQSCFPWCTPVCSKTNSHYQLSVLQNNDFGSYPNSLQRQSNEVSVFNRK